MFKIISIISILIICIVFIDRVYSAGGIYTPEYSVISKTNNIEIRMYEKIKLISTIETQPYKHATYSGFRTLAKYIFGNNKDNIEIPMTAPVITSAPDEINIEISFVVNKKYDLETLPEPNSKKITFKEIEFGRVAVISFGLWATPKRIKKNITKLEKYLLENSIQHSSEFLVAQYNSPWVMPPFRKNEILISID